MNKSRSISAFGLVIAAAAFCLIIPAAAQSPVTKTIEVGTATGPEAAWKKLTDPAEAFEGKTFEKLRTGDVDWIIDNTAKASYDKLGKDSYRSLLSQKIIPYFKDFSKPADDLTICVAKCGLDRGFSFYDFFYAADGKKKPYMIEVSSDKNQQQHIYGIVMGTSFKDEYPQGNEGIVLFRKQNANAFLGRE